jgi:hypothetical protein
MASPTHDVVATTGEYTNAAGEKKKRYVTCGKAFTDDQGRISLKMESMPVGPGWSGWLSLYPIERKEPHQAPDPRLAPRNLNVPANRSAAPPDDPDDEIPF